jgi:transposase InsO family protein
MPTDSEPWRTGLVPLASGQKGEPDRPPRVFARRAAVSESTAYRLLKRHGLIREMNPASFLAERGYRVKTTRVNEQWQSDANYFFVVGWYYLISVLDDYSQFILAWKVKVDMTAESIAK